MSGSPRSFPRNRLFLLAACAAACYLLFFFRLDALGLLSTDEPRYAAIGRAMALSGDWVTPRLWGAPWFEKPALLYWMTGAATLAGLGKDLAPRVPVALMSAAFVALFFLSLRREWGWRPAFYSAAILSTSAGWLVFSQSGVPDLPLTALFNGALLLALPWLRTGNPRRLPWAAALMGLAVLAKGLVPLVLLLPALWFVRGRWRALLAWPVPLVFAAVALPWYILCTLRNGPEFLRVFFLQHQLGRFTSGELQHVQPWWFFLPVLPACLFPWSALLGLLFRRQLLEDRAARLFAAIVVWGLVFFSLSANKLPGYILPLLPLVAALIGLSLHQVRFAAPWLVLPIFALAWVPVLAAMLPIALVSGIRKAWPVDTIVKFRAALLMLPLMLSAGAALLAERFAKRHYAVAGIFVLTLASIVWVKVTALPHVDPVVSTRSAYRAAPHSGAVCVEPMSRAWRYGLNYYFERNLPACTPALAATHLKKPE